MTFTEEDIENDSEIKEETAPKLQSLLSKKHSEIAEHYRILVEEDYGLTVGQDLADMLVRALNDEGYATQILNTDISLRQVKISDIREDDLDLVLEMKEKFADDDAEDKVGKFIESYLDDISSGGGAMGGLSLEDKRSDREVRRAEETLKEVRRERARLESIKEEIKEERGKAQPTESVSQETQTQNEKDIDDLFGSSDDTEEEETNDEEQEVEEEDNNEQMMVDTGANVTDQDETSDVPMSSEEGTDDE